MTPTSHRSGPRAALDPTPRSTIRAHPERARPDQAASILAAGLVAHVGFVEEGQPFVIPMSYHYDLAEPRRIHLHATHGGRIVRVMESGAPVCVTVTLVDGLVYSRTAKYHSMNYRSVVCYARASADQGDRAALLEGMIARYFPGRVPGRDYESAPAAHLEATGFVTLDIEEWSAKVRAGGPGGPRDREEAAPGTAGVVRVSAA